MPNSAGLLTLPVGSSTPTGDPLLATLGSFLQAALRCYCGDAWGDIGGGTDVCERVETNDPTDNTFTTTKLPCLAVFREESSNNDERIGDELYESKSNIVALWIPPVAVQNWKANRESFTRAIRAALHVAFTQQRVPGWVVDGDTDPLAATRGSDIVSALNLMRPILSFKTADFPLTIEMSDLPPKKFPAVKFTIPISEQLCFSPVRDSAKLNATLTTNDGPVTQTVEDVP